MLTRHVTTVGRCCYASGELEGLFAALAGVLSDLPVASNHADQVDPAKPGLAAEGIAAPCRAVIEEDEEDKQLYRSATRSLAENIQDNLPPETTPATRVSLLPHHPQTGEEIERDKVVKGYEYARGQFVTFTAEELKVLDVESSKIIDLERFVPRAEVDPVYFSTPYYVYPDGPIAVETFGVIGAAMAEAGTVGIGRVTLSRRERLVTVEPRGAGMVAITLRASEEVRTPAFATAQTEIDADMVAVAETIIKRRGGHFDPSTFRDRYQEALRALIEAKMKGLPVKPTQVASPTAVHDLMTALKRSLAQETGPAGIETWLRSMEDIARLIERREDFRSGALLIG